LIKHKCAQCGKIWYCKGSKHCKPKDAVNCCVKCSHVDNEDCQEIKGMENARLENSIEWGRE